MYLCMYVQYVNRVLYILYVCMYVCMCMFICMYIFMYVCICGA